MAKLKLSSSSEVLEFLQDLQERVMKLEAALEALAAKKPKKESAFFDFDDDETPEGEET